MTKDENQSSAQLTWIERLSHFLLREPQDRIQLLELLRDAQEREILNADAFGMIEGVMQVSEMQVRDIMIPRSQMVVVKENQSLEDFLPKLIESGHSRFPVIGDSRDEVTGILLAKDLLRLKSDSGHPLNTSQEPFELRTLLRPARFIPESKRVDILLKEFRLKRNHMAIVLDEYGGVAGLVTIEDVLEQIVGEIEDEYDVEDDIFIRRNEEGYYVVKALTPIDEFNKYFSTNISQVDFDTIGGLVTKEFGYFPKQNESVQFGNFTFTVLQADSRRVKVLKVVIGLTNL